MMLRATLTMCVRYVDMDKVDSGKEQVPSRQQQLESMTRLAESHAKVRLSYKVKVFDAND
jgi:DNA replicative helicase MCM subunit Mcm2 (Cdc46/Mcm family)